MLVANDAFGEAVKEVYEPDWPGRDKLIQYLEVCNNYHKTSVFEKMGLSSSSKEITRSVSSDMQAPISNLSNKRRSISSDTQTPITNIPNPRRSVLSYT